jgi:phage N-6-adenine-methyltransferase
VSDFFSSSAAFGSATDEWATPPDIYAQLHAEFGFDLDVCSTHENAKCHRHFTQAENGLEQEWTGTVWMNPPYGKHIGEWMERAYTASLNGATVVCLVPARTDTRWWHDFAMKGDVRFIKGRLTFGAAANPAPFPSAVVVFRPRREQAA